MKLILHIGMPKTGTTALQHGLARLRESLRDVGVLYPESPVITHKQALFIAGLTSSEGLPRHLRHRYKNKVGRIERDARTWWTGVGQQVEDLEPHTLILSDEALFEILDDTNAEELVRRLRTLAERVEVVAYVRRPSSFYLSIMQQTLKASHQIRPVHPTSYRHVLESVSAHADAVHVQPYDQRTWPGGDILRQFLGTFLPGVEVPLDDAPEWPNQSLTAEALSVLAEYRAVFWGDMEDRFTPDTKRLVRALTAAEADMGGAQRPRIHEPVRRFLDQASTDLLWLRDTHGVVFEEIDYDAVSADHPAVPQPTRVEDVCRVDPDRRAALILHTLRRLAAPSGA